MHSDWISYLKINPVSTLLSAGDPAFSLFTRRDLLDIDRQDVRVLWDLPEVRLLIKKQKPDGSWGINAKINPSLPGENYALLETFRNLRVLICVYGFTCESREIENAANFVFSLQTTRGDIRGIIGNQYMPYYHGAILELLINAGYADDPRVVKGLEWLLSMRQDDGGWIVPTQAIPTKQRTDEFWSGIPVEPDRTLPHSHLATGMAIRAFAAHPDYRYRQEIIKAGRCLKERLLHPDKYNDRRGENYWLKFQYPFWWTSLVSALDALSLLGFSWDDPDIHRGITWFIENQQPDGLWPTGYEKGRLSHRNRLWVGLAVCRVLRRIF